ncbi:MAG: hypothetical protein JWR21_3996 [Herminiimonas sp.]|nr:hypothetical protein [Herminiimonas sp.]
MTCLAWRIRKEPVFIQAFIPEFAIEALDVGILLRLSRFNES